MPDLIPDLIPGLMPGFADYNAGLDAGTLPDLTTLRTMPGLTGLTDNEMSDNDDTAGQ